MSFVTNQNMKSKLNKVIHAKKKGKSFWKETYASNLMIVYNDGHNRV